MSDQKHVIALLIEEEELVLYAAIGAAITVRRRCRRRKRTCWSRPWLLRRPQYGQYERLMAELAHEDGHGFRNFQRLDPDMFHELLARVGPRIQRQDTNWRTSLEPGLRLALTLRYLATGDSYMSLQYGFRVANNTICAIIPDTCEAIYAEIKDEVLRCPQTVDEWLHVSDQFASRWNVNNTIGALDGKHVAIRCPRNGGSVYYNYKGFHSIVMLALVDADYRFLFVDVGANGRCSDAGIFGECSLRDALETGCLGLSDPAPQRNMTRPERIYNYRLSRARRVVENAFGILANRFRCLLGTCAQQPKRVESIILACCTLHNLMRARFPAAHQALVDQEDQETNDLVPGSWRDDPALHSLEAMHGNNMTRAAKGQRQYLCSYYNSQAGSVPWQDAMI